MPAKNTLGGTKRAGLTSGAISTPSSTTRTASAGDPSCSTTSPSVRAASACSTRCTERVTDGSGRPSAPPPPTALPRSSGRGTSGTVPRTSAARHCASTRPLPTRTALTGVSHRVRLTYARPPPPTPPIPSALPHRHREAAGGAFVQRTPALGQGTERGQGRLRRRRVATHRAGHDLRVHWVDLLWRARVRGRQQVHRGDVHRGRVRPEPVPFRGRVPRRAPLHQELHGVRPELGKRK